MKLFRLQTVPLSLLSLLLQIAVIAAILLCISIIECTAYVPETQLAFSSSSLSPSPAFSLLNQQLVPRPPGKRTQPNIKSSTSASASQPSPEPIATVAEVKSIETPVTDDTASKSSASNHPKPTPSTSTSVALQESSDHTTEPANDAATTPTSRKTISNTAIACIIAIPTLLVALGIGLAINLYIRRRKRAHDNKGTNYSTGDDTFGTREMPRADSNHSQKSQRTRKLSEPSQRTRRLFRGGSLDLRRSSAVTRSVGRAGLPQTWNSRSMSFSHAINRPAAIPAPAMLETGKASGVLSDASAFPPVPGPSRPLERRARAGLGENRAMNNNRWTVTIDTSDMQVVPLPPPNYKDALKEPPAPTDV